MNNEQWQDLCVRFGFYQRSTTDMDRRSYMEWRHEVSAYEHYPYMSRNLPPQDMNSLFRWMWPRIPTDKREVILDMICLPLINDPFEALAQAIYRTVRYE